jgi:hypothetical protein
MFLPRDALEIRGKEAGSNRAELLVGRYTASDNRAPLISLARIARFFRDVEISVGFGKGSILRPRETITLLSDRGPPGANVNWPLRGS